MRACICRLVCLSVAESIPARIFPKVEFLAIQGHVCNPCLSWVIPRFEDGQEAKVREGRALKPVLLAHGAGSRFVFQYERQQTGSFTLIGSVGQSPIVNLIGR